MNDLILKAIADSLPSMQMEELKKELDKAKKYTEVSAELADEIKNTASLTSKISDLNYEISVLKSNILKKEEIEKRERELQVELLKKDVQCSKDISSAIKELAMAAFRNPTISKTFNSHVAVPSGGWTTPCHNTETSKIE